MSASKELDQFYTSAPVAKECWLALKPLLPKGPKTFLEPSAGSGAFLNLMPKAHRLGLDLEPKHAEVRQMDFLQFRWEIPHAGHVITVGNPPFGKNASLAVRFFNHAAQFSQVVAFVVPKTFRKASLQKRLSTDFHLLLDINLPANAFEFEGVPYDVPCCFQVWHRTDSQRIHKDTALTHPDFSFVGKNDADFAIRRIGGRAGAVIEEFASYSAQSHYYIKANLPIAHVKAILKSADWSEARENNAGNPSISKRELVSGYARQVAQR
jgi:hypothetical protein